ncbi:MAG: M1 family metallopeptidase [Bryobacterales bacterium]
METAAAPATEPKDVHSYANADEVRVRHVSLDLTVDFERKVLSGATLLQIEPVDGVKPMKLVVDTRDLEIRSALASIDGVDFAETEFSLASADPILGSALTIQLPEGAKSVRVDYETSPSASGLQWLDPAQTAGKKHPFLFSQSQAIHARSWIPLQDSPGVRVTYQAVIRVAEPLRAVMSAETLDEGPREFRFQLDKPIPPYLIALAAGDIAYEAISERTGVYAEPSVVESAAKEFEDVDSMLQKAEALFGPYRWGRYDILVLPPSFPFGGMENARLTFATPTLLAGDKSLVGVIAHELAHSWSGNLVTNATWSDFWLNEGFTVYLENRIQEAVFGPQRALMEGALEVQELRDEMATLEPRDQILHVNLDGRDPDDGFTQVPYVKGMLLLRTIEKAVGRPKFDPFLRGYFDHFAFQSITTADFVAYLTQELPEAVEQVDVEAWTEEPGIPADAAIPVSHALEEVAKTRERWLSGAITVTDLPAKSWSTQEWLAFLSGLPADAGAERLAELDAAYHLSDSHNAEILSRWLLESIKRGYKPADKPLEAFLTTVGRRKFLKPLYEELAKTEAGKRRGLEIYAKARSGYHPIAQVTVDQILGYRP